MYFAKHKFTITVVIIGVLLLIIIISRSDFTLKYQDDVTVNPIQVETREEPNVIKVPNSIFMNIDLDNENLLDYITNEFIMSFMVSQDLCLVNKYELLFNDSTEISSDILFRFFIYLKNELYNIENGAKGDSGGSYLKKDNKYHIPLTDIQCLLSASFKEVNFNPEDVEYVNYITDKEEFVENIFSGFGGLRYYKVISKEKLNKNTVKVIISYYESERLSKSYKTIEYVMDYFNNSWRYISITKK